MLERVRALLEVMIACIGVIGVIGTCAAPFIARDLLIQRRWRAAARRLGFRFVRGALTGGDQLHGESRGFRLTIDNVDRRHTHFSLSAYPRVEAELSVRRSLMFDAFVREEALTTGDRAFDRTLVVRGLPHLVIPLLDREARAAIVDVVERRDVEIANGFITCRVSGVIQDSGKLDGVVQDLARVAETLEVVEPLPLKLLENATRDDEPSRFRAANLALLVARHCGSDETRTACRSALERPHAEEMMLGVIGLTSSGALRGPSPLDDWPVVSADAARRERDPAALAAGLTLARSDAIEPEIRARAIAHMARILDRSALGSLLAELAASARAAVRAQVARLLVTFATGAEHAEHARALDLLLEIARYPVRQPDPLIAAADALAAIAQDGDRAVEAALLALLGHEDPEVKVAACRALERVGGIGAVKALLDAARPLLAEYALKRAARAAVRAIQDRHPAAESGRLSLVEAATEGALSVAAERTGALSVEVGTDEVIGVTETCSAADSPPR